jgi:single-stranded DNA-binding protein
MNSLNSVLIEGILTEDPAPIGKTQCVLHVRTKRSEKRDEISYVQEDDFTILTNGKIAETCAEFLKEGRNIRIVGRLITAENVSRLYGCGGSREGAFTFIMAEHVEIKPTK